MVVEQLLLDKVAPSAPPERGLLLLLQGHQSRGPLLLPPPCWAAGSCIGSLAVCTAHMHADRNQTHVGVNVTSLADKPPATAEWHENTEALVAAPF